MWYMRRHTRCTEQQHCRRRREIHGTSAQKRRRRSSGRAVPSPQEWRCRTGTRPGQRTNPSIDPGVEQIRRANLLGATIRESGESLKNSCGADRHDGILLSKSNCIHDDIDPVTPTAPTLERTHKNQLGSWILPFQVGVWCCSLSV